MSRNYLDLEIEYKGTKIIERFYIIDSRQGSDIIVGFNALKKIQNDCLIPIQCEIDTGEKGPVNWTRPIRSYKDRIDFYELLKDLESRGIIEKSNSRWLNPIVLTRKQNGKLRFCVDFRRLNDLVTLDTFEIPKFNEIIITLRDCKYFSLVDLKDGFFNVNLKPEDRCKTAFFTGERIMQFKKMPQGYKNSPQTFQRVMNYIFEDLIGKICIIYIDDILIYGKNEEEHKKNFEIVQERLKKYKFTENYEKRRYCKKQIEFLGYEIGFNSIKPKCSRSQGIKQFSTPENRKQLQRFLGMLNYDRLFIPNMTEKLQNLYKLLQKETKFTWNENAQKEFDNIKDEWSKHLEVIIPNMTAVFELETDASDVGIGACLRQNSKPVAYISRTLNKAERNYSITEKEVLAAIWSMEKLEFYLMGNQFILTTDHKAIEFIKSKQEFGSQRIMRWYERINRFQFTVKYKKGENLIVADALSRSFPKEGEERIDLEEMKRKRILKIHENLTHRKNIRQEIIKEGIILSENELSKILKECEVCARMDAVLHKSSKYVQVEAPGEKVAIDLLFISDKNIIIVLIDYFSRKVFAQHVTSKEGFKVLQFVKKVFEVFPFKTLLSDNGKEFLTKSFEEWLKKKNIIHQYSIPYYHQSNGRVERVNRTLRTAINKTPGSLRTKLPEILKVYNNTFHRAIGMSPEEGTRPENREKIMLHELKYKMEFGRKDTRKRELYVGQKVYVKNELRKNKNENIYNDVGLIIEKNDYNIYLVELEDKSLIRRHVSQLKEFKEGEVGPIDSSRL